jgi:hypothetical protein
VRVRLSVIGNSENPILPALLCTPEEQETERVRQRTDLPSGLRVRLYEHHY